jgi:hypothetical protein
LGVVIYTCNLNYTGDIGKEKDHNKSLALGKNETLTEKKLKPERVPAWLKW